MLKDAESDSERIEDVSPKADETPPVKVLKSEIPDVEDKRTDEKKELRYTLKEAGPSTKKEPTHGEPTFSFKALRLDEPPIEERSRIPREIPREEGTRFSRFERRVPKGEEPYDRFSRFSKSNMADKTYVPATADSKLHKFNFREKYSREKDP